MKSVTTLPLLFCKPPSSDEGLFVKTHQDTQKLFRIESLQPDVHLPIIYQWVNQSYTQRFWQMAGPYEELHRTYTSIQASPSAHSFVGFYNDVLLCQADFYLLGADELGEHFLNDVHQCGIHILTAPPRTHPIPKLSLHFLQCFTEFYFSHPAAQRLYGEPDHQNELVHLLVKRAGFSFIKQVQLKHKVANVFCLERPHPPVPGPSKSPPSGET